jgi:hypothetical protein
MDGLRLIARVPKMKFAMKKAVFHKKFHFWTRAINQIQNFFKKKIFLRIRSKIFLGGATHQIIR